MKTVLALISDIHGNMAKGRTGNRHNLKPEDDSSGFCMMAPGLSWDGGCILFPAPILTASQAETDFLSWAGCPARICQLRVVMALPQRGQIEPPVAQVVPQWEQVLTRQEQDEELGFAGGQDAQPPLETETAPLELLQSTSSKAQEDWGKRGREKNSSHTDSANSSQGGISQKP